MASQMAYPPLHTAEHLLTRLLFESFPGLTEFNTRLKSRKAVATFRYEGEIGEADRMALETALQHICAADLSVTVFYLPRAEAEACLPNLHQVPEDADPVRVVRIGEGDTLADERACIGTHVSSTGEIRNLRLPTLAREGEEQWRVNLVVDRSG